VKLFAPTDEKQWKRKGIIPKRTKKKSMQVVEHEEWEEVNPQGEGRPRCARLQRAWCLR
jgi:hypothetical protein